MKTVLTSGGYDPLHRGHINLFKSAKAIGDRLIVVVECDAYIEAKHPLLLPQIDRAAIIRELGCVDLVLLNDQPDGNTAKLLHSCRPDIYVVGPDHFDVEKLPEWGTCQELGIRVICLDTLEKSEATSSSYLIRKLKPKWDNPPVCISALITRGVGRVLIGKRRQLDGVGKWELPGGFLEVNETLEEGVKREVREELGAELWIGASYYSSFVTTYSDGRKILSVYFICTIGEPPVESNEMGEFCWIRRGEIPEPRTWFSDADYRAAGRYLLGEGN